MSIARMLKKKAMIHMIKKPENRFQVKNYLNDVGRIASDAITDTIHSSIFSVIDSLSPANLDKVAGAILDIEEAIKETGISFGAPQMKVAANISDRTKRFKESIKLI